MRLSLIFLALLSGCASGPSIKNQSDIAQMLDTASTITAIEIVGGFSEGNPLMQPFAGGWGYLGMVGIKLGINMGLRNSSPDICEVGIRASTSAGYGAAVSNTLLMIGLSTGYGLVGGLGIAFWNYFANDSWKWECRIESGE
jgi:hypothetical protein